MQSEYIYLDGLTSERLSTRWLRADDAAAWVAFTGNPEAMKFFSFPTNLPAAERAEEWIERQMLRYSEKRYGMQALIHRDTGAFVGQCGLLMQEVDGMQELEVGYHMLPEYWGHGYATEAAVLFCEFAAKHRLASSIISIIHRENIRSQRVALRHGMVAEKETVWNALPVVIYRKALA